MHHRQVGEGAFATVLKGSVTLDGTKHVAAIKRLKPSMLNDRDFKDFVLEAAVLSKLDHPCIVKMFGVGTTSTTKLSGDSFYVVSEYCDGGNLKDLLYKQVLCMSRSHRCHTAMQMEVPYKRMYSMDDAIRWCLQIARGLKYLHASRPMVRTRPETRIETEQPCPHTRLQVIHRDLKPENILLSGTPCVCPVRVVNHHRAPQCPRGQDLRLWPQRVGRV